MRTFLKPRIVFRLFLKRVSLDIEGHELEVDRTAKEKIVPRPEFAKGFARRRNPETVALASRMSSLIASFEGTTLI